MGRARYHAWLAVALAGVMVAGWGASGPAAAAPKAGSTKLEGVNPSGQTVVFWYHYTRERKEALSQLIEQFNAANPYGIKVQGVYMGSSKDIYARMKSAARTGELPQLVDAYNNQAREYYKSGAVVDLTPYMQSQAWGLSDSARADYLSELLARDSFQGVQVAFRTHYSVEMLYYNRDWLRELGYQAPPRSWSDFAEMCRKAKSQPFSRSTNKSRSLGFMLETDASRLASMVFSRGGSLTNEEGTSYQLDSPQMRASLGMLRDLFSDASIDTFSEAYGDRRAFADGQVLFAMRSSSGLLAFRTDIESGLDFDWDVATVPFDGPSPVNNIYGSSIAVCAATQEQQLAAWLFLRWFTQPAEQTLWVQGSIYFPVRLSAVQGYAPYIRRAYAFLGTGVSEPSLPRYEEVRGAIVKAMLGAMAGQDVDKTLSRLQFEANQTLSGN